MEDKQRMFQNPFSLKGRIRRLEYGLSYIIFMVYALFAGFFVGFSGIPESMVYIVLLPGYCFIIPQGTKRCHDRGNSGWFQIIPFYGLWMLFAGSDYGENEYGLNPKGEGNESVEDMIDNIGVPEQG